MYSMQQKDNFEVFHEHNHYFYSTVLIKKKLVHAVYQDNQFPSLTVQKTLHIESVNNPSSFNLTKRTRLYTCS